MYCQRYHVYLIPEEVQLKDAIAFEYGNRLSIAPKADKEIANKDSVAVVERRMTNF